MAKHGGARQGAGRKAKADEQALIEKLTLYEDEAHKQLKQAVQGGEQWAIKLYFEYRYGKPNQQLDAKVTIEEIFVDFDEETD